MGLDIDILLFESMAIHIRTKQCHVVFRLMKNNQSKGEYQKPMNV